MAARRAIRFLNKESFVHLYLIRHGQSHINLSDWDWNSGATLDQPLTELGERQAEALAAWLPSHLPTVAAIYASTMRRAQQTAEPLAEAYRVPVRFDHRVREIGNNRIDHTAWPEDEAPNRYSKVWVTARPFSPTMHDAESSETFMHTRVRVGLFIEELVERHRGESVLVVCHGGVIDCAFDHIFNIGPWRRCEMWTNNTGVTHFEVVNHPDREVWRLHYYNRTDHLLDASMITG
jgi:probable phosphoglycerate mutase